jgi:DNA polymerase elongation subunit (family B)
LKILLLDLETAPNTAYIWGLYDNYIPIDRLIDSGYTLCWAAKWLGEREILFDSIHQSTPKKMIQRIHKLLDEADAVIHYNGTKFDIPTINKEFLLHGLTPPAPFKQIDLLKTARRQFRFPSNKLDYVSKALGLGQKTKHKGLELWIGCMNGDESCWRTMERYNKQDVKLLEKVYLKMLPWIKNHPNVALFDLPGELACTSCGSHHVQRRGYAHTKTAIYARYQCRSCGHWDRARTLEKQFDRSLVLTEAA